MSTCSTCPKGFARSRFAALILGFFLASGPTHALSIYSAGDVSKLTDDLSKTLIQTIGIGADHRPYEPATPLGAVVGLDIGLDVTGVAIPQEFKDAMAAAGAISGTDTSSFPSAIPVPRVSIHKGLPFGIDIGGSYFGYDQYKMIGADLKWAILKGMAKPSIAIRLGGNYTNLFFMKTRTWSVDALVSKKLIFIDPYVGFGYQWGSGDLDVPLEGATGLPISVSGHQTYAQPRFTAGLALKLFLLKLTPQYEYSFAKISTYGLKVSLSL